MNESPFSYSELVAGVLLIRASKFIAAHRACCAISILPGSTQNRLPLLADDPCPAISGEIRRFDTGTITHVSQLPGVSDWITYPNPVNAGDHLRVALSVTDAFTGSVELLDATGRIVRRRIQRRFAASEQIDKVMTTGLSSGVHIVLFRNGAHTAQRRIVIN